MPDSVTWVLVADGARAQIFARQGSARELEPVATRSCAANRIPNRDIFSNQPGRGFASAAPKRHAMAPASDPHPLSKRRFLKELAALLEQGRRAQAYDRLILVAPPPALGELHASLTPACLRLVCAEIGSDLTRMSLAHLSARLGDRARPRPPA